MYQYEYYDLCINCIIETISIAQSNYDTICLIHVLLLLSKVIDCIGNIELLHKCINTQINVIEITKKQMEENKKEEKKEVEIQFKAVPNVDVYSWLMSAKFLFTHCNGVSRD
jgi:hypothetical protein